MGSTDITAADLVAMADAWDAILERLGLPDGTAVMWLSQAQVNAWRAVDGKPALGSAPHRVLSIQRAQRRDGSEYDVYVIAPVAKE